MDNSLYLGFGPLLFLNAVDGVQRKLHVSDLPSDDMHNHVVVTVDSILDRYLEIDYPNYDPGSEDLPV